jgi:hypothetical protein
MKFSNFVCAMLFGLLVGKQLAAEDLKPYKSEEFMFLAPMPAEVLVSKAQHQNGTMGSFKAFDGSQGLIYSLTVNKVTAFMSEGKDSKLNWVEILEANFGAWTGGMSVIEGTLNQTTGKWNSDNAIHYSFSAKGILGDDAVSFHRGVQILRNGIFYSLSIISPKSDDDTLQAAKKFEEALIIFDVMHRTDSR